MNTFKLSLGAIAIVVAQCLASPAQAAQPTLPGDGWVSWQVPAFDGAPAWCCFDSRKGRGGVTSSCRLDDGSNGYGVRDEKMTDSLTVYARSTGGKLDRLQVLATSCPVETKTPVDTLENVATDDSARWLITRIEQHSADAGARHPIGESALAALAMHRGDLARDALARFAHDERFETRKSTVFWLAMVRGEEGAGVTSSVMFTDPSAELREHAAFALSQSKAARVTPDLIRLGNTDKSADVRSKAWFWLAQSESAGAEAAISAAVRKDPDDQVREQAVFALSQLPDERATRALAALAEDRSLPHEQRKRAVFWLSQSESDAAQAYLEKVLAVSSGARQ